MPNPSATPTPITPPRVPFFDERTGLIDRAWYQFFLSLYRTADSVVSVQDLNFSVDPLISSYDAALRALAQTTETQPNCDVESLQQQLNELRQEAQTLPTFDGAAVTLIGGNTNSIVYQSSPNSTTFLPPPSSFLLVDSVDVLSTEASDPIVTQPALYLQYGTDDTLSWSSTYDLSVAYASALIGGSTGSIAYQSNEDVTTFLNIGAAAQILKVNAGATAPEWVSGAALTKTDDTNVTLTLGGSPTTSLLAATSLTLGWTGQLAVSRGGTGVSTTTANYVFAGPTSGGAAAPTFRALVSSDIPSLTYVSSVSGTLPISSSGGLTPTISISQATSSTNGYLSSTDWTTFNNKQSTSSPVTKTANFSVASTDVWLINNKTGSSCTVTLPSASTSSGRVLYFLNYQNQTLVSASSNVVPLAGGAATTAILEAVAGSNATLVSDGTNWVMTQYDSNNSLQLG